MLHDNRPGAPGRLTGLLTVLAVLAALLVGLSLGSPAAAVPGDPPLITYNLQGATSGQDSKWTTTVGNYAQRAEIVALQEAGPTPPPQAPGLPQPADTATQDPNLPQIGRGNVVQHRQWRSGPVNYEVYFLQTDWNGGTYVGGRNNLALVTQRPADEVVALPGVVVNQPTHARSRGVLGARFDNTWYFTLHAQSNGPNAQNDATALLNTIDTFVTSRNLGETWIALGDYNQDPGNLAVPAGSRIYNSGQATQLNGGELDYAVSNDPNGAVLPGRLAGASSDHFAFFLGQLRGGAEPRELYAGPRTLESMQNGGVLDPLAGLSGNFTPVITFHRNNADSQSWHLDIYPDNSIRFRGVKSNRCLDISHSDSAAAGRGLVLWDCADQASQRWTTEEVGDGEVELRNTLRTDLCATVAGAANSANGGALVVNPCQDGTNQRFLFTPAQTTSAPNPNPLDLSRYETLPRSVESMDDGGILDPFHGDTDNGTGLITFTRNGAPSQGWQLDWSNDHTVRLHGTASDRCIDLPDTGGASPEGRAVVLSDCGDQASQSWLVNQFDNEQVSFQNASQPSLCLDNFAFFNSRIVILQPCNSTAASQQWLFTAFDPTTPPEPEWIEHDEL